MKKLIWPLLIIFFLAGGLITILVGQVALPPEPRLESVATISEKWSNSGHGNTKAEAFIHWDEDDPPEVPKNCAKCHSAYGYLDYLGEDETEAQVVDAAANIGSVVTCYVCHNPSASEKDTAYFPSGAKVDDLAQNANCAECHQGTRSGLTVQETLGNLPEDEVNEELGFINVHYKIGGAVRYGSDAGVGYEYPDENYVGFYTHVEDYQQCTDCHDPHSLEITPDECAACHPVVSDLGDVRNIRTENTPDYDNDGDTSEGIYAELTTIHDLLFAAIQTYAHEIVGDSIIYANQYPYWFIDTNGNNQAEEDEVAVPNRYTNWTPRLVKATFNYHMVLEDPGNFMHNARYLIQIMYDTLNDLSQVINIDISGLIRPE
jgi:hypothetical protein